MLAGAGELAGMVMGFKGKVDEGIRRAVLGYIMAFPVALKVSWGLLKFIA